MLLTKHHRVSFFIVLLTFSGTFLLAQTATVELRSKWEEARRQKGYRRDTASVLLLNRLSDQYLYDHADSALYFAKLALGLAVEQKWPPGQVKSWNRISKARYVKGEYSGSLDAASALMNISHKINYRPGIGWAYQIMGLVYLAQDNNSEAINNFNKAAKLFVAVKDTAQLGKVYFDLGICYDESGEPENAFFYLERAIRIGKASKDDNLVSMATNRTGETWFHLKNFHKALACYQQVINSKNTSNWEKDFSYSGMAKTYYVLGNYNDAILNAQKSYALSKKVNSEFDAVRALQVLADSYAAVNDYKNAYIYEARLKKLNDSLFNSEKEREINKQHLKQQQADNKRLEKEINNKEQAIAFSKKLLFFRNILAVAVAIFVIFIIINNRQKTALNKLLQQQNKDIALQKEEISSQKEVVDQLNITKDRLFSVISHDLRSPFAAILQSIDAIRAGDITVEEQEFLLDGFYRQVTLVTNMVNNLLAWANSQQLGITSNFERLDITAVVNDIISVSSFLAKNKSITLQHNYDGEKWVLADADHAKIILQNLVGNAIKFTPKGGSVTVFYSDDEDYQAIHVKDTGTGISPEKLDRLFKVTGKEISDYGTNNEAGAGIGLVLIKQFTDANQGKLEVQSKVGEGSEFTVYLRKS